MRSKSSEPSRGSTKLLYSETRLRSIRTSSYADLINYLLIIRDTSSEVIQVYD